jgi:hypothetical protein
MKKAFTILACLAISACNSSGTKVTEQQAAQFTPGKTTQADVIAALGQPNQNMRNADGSSTITYFHMATAVNAASFIPVVGMFAGGISSSNDSVVFSFDKAGLLTGHTSSNGSQEMATGLLNH